MYDSCTNRIESTYTSNVIAVQWNKMPKSFHQYSLLYCHSIYVHICYIYVCLCYSSLIYFYFLFSCIFAGSHGTLLGVLNAFVHVIMYSYYFLTSVRPELRGSAWWKKHITQIQLVWICFCFFFLVLFHWHSTCLVLVVGLPAQY